jgi:membrane protein
MAQRPLLHRIGWTLRDYARRVWDNSGEDNIFFLAGGVSFNILLAVVPFVLLFTAGLTYLLNESPDDAAQRVSQMVTDLLPAGASDAHKTLVTVLTGIIKARGEVTIFGLIGFVWFSTRLFGSLRTVLAAIFDIESDRGIVDGKIFDIKITIVGSLLLVLYTIVSFYIFTASTRGVTILEQLGIRDDIMGTVQYTFLRIVAFSFIALMFFALYKYLPNRHMRWQQALFASMFTSAMFELARNIFASYVTYFQPSSLYEGTIAAVVIVVVWVYYAAMIFILGGEVAQVYELRRIRKLQREEFED